MLEIEQKKAGFAVVSLMGHTVRAGFLTIDEKGRHDLVVPRIERDRGTHIVVWEPRTCTFYPQSVFEIDWCSEERARSVITDSFPRMLAEPEGPKPPPIGEGFQLELDVLGDEAEKSGRKRITATAGAEGWRFERNDTWPERYGEWVEAFPCRFELAEELGNRRAVMFDAAGVQVWPPLRKDKYIVSVYAPLRVEPAPDIPVPPLEAIAAILNGPNAWNGTEDTLDRIAAIVDGAGHHIADWSVT